MRFQALPPRSFRFPRCSSRQHRRSRPSNLGYPIIVTTFARALSGSPECQFSFCKGHTAISKVQRLSAKRECVSNKVYLTFCCGHNDSSMLIHLMESSVSTWSPVDIQISPGSYALYFVGGFIPLPSSVITLQSPMQLSRSRYGNTGLIF